MTNGRISVRPISVAIRNAELARTEKKAREDATDSAAEAKRQAKIAGENEAQAVALAWACHRALDPGFRPPEEIARPRSPGCFEVFEPGPVIVDGAHTPDSLRLLVGEIARRCGDERFDLLDEIRSRVAAGERVLVTTLTKRMAEELTEHLADAARPFLIDDILKPQ